jgi:hypothetical protein
MKVIDHTTLHRTAKYFMDNGRAATHEEALAILGGFGLTIHMSPETAATPDGQVALLTLVNLARRTFLAGVEVVGVKDQPLVTRVGSGATLGEAVVELGAVVAVAASACWPRAVIGPVDLPGSPLPTWHLAWDGWRAGVLTGEGRSFDLGMTAMPLAPAMAAAVCAAEVFAFHAGDHGLAGKRSAGLSLWCPGRDWMELDESEPRVAYLPSRLWLIGLGNLGQAYSWLLACMPYAADAEVELVLQDFDRLAPSNDSTSLLSSSAVVGEMKTRHLAAWLETRGFKTFIEERRFGAWTRRTSEEPAVALCGVDNGVARAALEKANFELVIESGLGAGPQSFRNFSMHTFPGSRPAEEIWSATDPGTGPDVSGNPAYEALRSKGADACGLAQLASRTVGVPFVGLLAAGIVVSELLRRLHGGTAFEVVSCSALNLGDIESVQICAPPFSYGHLAAEGAP